MMIVVQRAPTYLKRTLEIWLRDRIQAHVNPAPRDFIAQKDQNTTLEIRKYLAQ